MKNKISINFRNKVNNIISSIDLNYVLAEARQRGYQVSLVSGILDEKIIWTKEECFLSYNYEISTGIVYQFISQHQDKIVKMHVSSMDDFYPINRTMIVYVPYHIDIKKIKKEYFSVVDCD